MYTDEFCNIGLSETTHEGEGHNSDKDDHYELIQDVPHEKDMLCDPYEFLDVVTGQSFDKRMAREARKFEMRFFTNMKVYDKVPQVDGLHAMAAR